ncbi:unnamed protein product [Rotaria sp. Silwood1]|nr:unnamed protein product [Rotaria sp. Silwood1]
MMFNEGIISNSLSPGLLPSMNSINTCENETQCLKIAYFSCHHCSKSLCLEHLNIHNTLNTIQVQALSNELDGFVDLVSNFDTQKTSQNAHNKLDAWKKQISDDIENIYESNLNEMNYLATELNQRLNIIKDYLRLKISNLGEQLLTIQSVDEISQQVQLLPIECDLNQLHQLFESVQCELNIDTKNISINDLIKVHNVFSYERTLPNNTQLESYRTISVENMKQFVSSKQNKSILWLDNQRQLHYINDKFQTRLLNIPQTLLVSSIILSNNRQIRINDVDIVDIKWCSFAEVFLILLQRHLLSFNHQTDRFTQISITRYKDYPFRCISCFNDTSLYISYCTSGTCIELWKYSYGNENDIYLNECIKRWDCLTNDKNEWISHMNTISNLYIGLLICKGSTIYRRFELRDKNLNLLKIIQLDNDYVDRFFPFRNHYWFIKSLSGKYYIYSIETNTYHLSSFDFPLGLEEFGINSLVIGIDEKKLILCDI